MHRLPESILHKRKMAFVKGTPCVMDYVCTPSKCLCVCIFVWLQVVRDVTGQGNGLESPSSPMIPRKIEVDKVRSQHTFVLFMTPVHLIFITDELDELLGICAFYIKWSFCDFYRKIIPHTTRKMNTSDISLQKVF